MKDPSDVRIELRACAACGAVVVDQDRHFDWHAAIRAGTGPALDYRPDYELVGLIEAVNEVDIYDRVGLDLRDGPESEHAQASGDDPRG